MTFNCKCYPLLSSLHFSFKLLWYCRHGSRVQFRHELEGENVREKKIMRLWTVECFRTERSVKLCQHHNVLIRFRPLCSSPRSSLCSQAVDAFGKFTRITSWAFNPRVKEQSCVLTSTFCFWFFFLQQNHVKCLSPKRCCCWASPSDTQVGESTTCWGVWWQSNLTGCSWWVWFLRLLRQAWSSPFTAGCMGRVSEPWQVLAKMQRVWSAFLAFASV